MSVVHSTQCAALGSAHPLPFVPAVSKSSAMLLYHLVALQPVLHVMFKIARCVVQGREHEWLFASEEGQKQVAAGCASRRVIIVSLGRSQHFGDLAALQVISALSGYDEKIALPCLCSDACWRCVSG